MNDVGCGCIARSSFGDRGLLPITLTLAASSLVQAQQPAEEPVSGGPQEKVQVTLLQIDALALDSQGRTVPDLVAADFSMKLGNVPLTVSTVDLTCPIGATDDPEPLKDDATAPPAPIAPGDQASRRVRVRLFVPRRHDAAAGARRPADRARPDHGPRRSRRVVPSREPEGTGGKHPARQGPRAGERLRAPTGRRDCRFRQNAVLLVRLRVRQEPGRGRRPHLAQSPEQHE